MSYLHRRNFVLGSLAALAGSSAAAGRGDKFSIGLMADAQYADVPHQGNRHYRASIEKLQTAVQEFNKTDLQLCVHLGDLIDRDWDSFTKPLAALSKLRHPCLHILGNHDYSVAESHLSEVPSRLSMRANYFATTISNFRFLFLDTNDISTYAHPPGSPDHALAKQRLAGLQKNKLPNAQSWNGAISEGQLKWLSSECTEAEDSGQRVALFAHHPVFPKGSHNVWNASEVLSVIDRHANIVAWFNGHNHAGGYATRKGVHYVTLHGMVESKDTTAFSVAEFNDRSISIRGSGREPSRELQFPA